MPSPNMGLLPWLDNEKNLHVAVREYEKFWIHQALVANNGITKAAKALGIHHQALRWKLDNTFPELAYLAPKRKRSKNEQ